LHLHLAEAELRLVECPLQLVVVLPSLAQLAIILTVVLPGPGRRWPGGMPKCLKLGLHVQQLLSKDITLSGDLFLDRGGLVQ